MAGEYQPPQQPPQQVDEYLSDFKDDEPIPTEMPEAAQEVLFDIPDDYPCSDGMKTLYRTYCKKRNALLRKYYLQNLLIMAKDDGTNPAIVAIYEDLALLQRIADTANLTTYCIVTPGLSNKFSFVKKHAAAPPGFQGAERSP